MKGIAAPNPLRRLGLRVAGLAPVAPLVAAREGGSNAGSPGVAHVASSSASTSSSPGSSASHEPLAFSRCMRAHGVTDFPDPDPHGGPGGRGGPGLRGRGIDMNSPQFKAA